MKLKVMQAEGKPLVNINTKNPEYSTIMVGCDTPVINNGMLNIEKRRAFFTGKNADINALVEEYGLKHGDEFPLDCKIIVEEATEPFFAGQQPKINPTTKEPVTYLGAPVYRNSTVVGIDSPSKDVRLPSDTTTVSKVVAEANAQANKVFGN